MTEYLGFVAELKKVPPAKTQGRRGPGRSRSTGLESVKGRLIKNISRGFKQRVGIAQALIHDPQGPDPGRADDRPRPGPDPRDPRASSKSLRGEHTIILSTHILAEVTQTCDGVVIINEGRLMASGSLDELTASVEQQGRRRPQGPPRRRRGRRRARGPCPASRRSSAPRATICASSGSPARDLRDDVARLAVEKGFGLLEMRPIAMNIEDLYLKIVSGGVRTMKNIWIIAKKELRTYFTSPIAYVVMTVFLVLVGFFFYSLLWWFNAQAMQVAQNPYYAQQININQMVFGPLFHNMSIILLLMLPLLTMRLFAEEKKIGTEELLYTSPDLGRPDHPGQVPGLPPRPGRHARPDRPAGRLHLPLRQSRARAHPQRLPGPVPHGRRPSWPSASSSPP